jgi:hypothetical protein
MFDVRAISLYHTEEINTLSNYSVKHAAPKARTTVIADVPKDEQVEIPVKSLQKKIEIQDKLKWFKTLLGHDNELDVFKKTANQYLL